MPTNNKANLNFFKIAVLLTSHNRIESTLACLNNIFTQELPNNINIKVFLVDDGSTDKTRLITKQLNLKYAFHRVNLGYGGNQKTCYALALAEGADIVVMLHPDYQYEPRLLTALASMVTSGVYDVAIASRILGHDAIKGGMPYYKYISNRFLTWIQNILIGQKLSEYHTGYRAFTKKVLTTLPLLRNSDDFIFDNEMLVQCHAWGFKIAEISCPTKYFPEASSINFSRSLKYGLGTLRTSLAYRFKKMGLLNPFFLRDTINSHDLLSAKMIEERILETNVKT